MAEFDNDIYKECVDYLFDGVCFLDEERMITYWNQGAERITGHAPSEVLGKHCSDNILVHVDDTGERLCPTDRCPAKKAMRDNAMCEMELSIHHKDGHRMPVIVRITPMRNPRGTVIGSIEMFSDNSEMVEVRKKAEILQKFALLDTLTELGNARYAKMCVNARLAEMIRYGWPFGVLYIDVDHFRLVNDGFGQAVGDRILRMIALTIVKNSRPFDIFCRLGGEEFVGIIANVNEAGLYANANRLRMLIEHSGLSVGKDIIKVTASFGAAIVEANDTIDSILGRSHALMERSKASGANCISMRLYE